MKSAILAADLSFGDAGKGTITDWLARQPGARMVVRYNGGSQAGHNVVLPDSRHHTFSQFGSGTFVAGIQTHLAKEMLVNPAYLLPEGRHLAELGATDAFDRLSVSGDCVVATWFHVAANRLREIARGDANHGSCGQGIGETRADHLQCGEDSLFIRDLLTPITAALKLRSTQERMIAEVEKLQLPETHETRRELGILYDDLEYELGIFRQFVEKVRILNKEQEARLLNADGLVIFEGAQGVLIDEWHGFHPYTTWSNTTFENAEALLSEVGYDGEVSKLGILRAYYTRHGAGPFVTENAALGELIPDAHNGNNRWQQGFRIGWFDAIAARYALEVVGGVDQLAITNLDLFETLPDWQICRRYQAEMPIKNKDQFQLNAEGLIIGISPSSGHDLDYQARLTEKLSVCRPVYNSVGRDVNGYLNLLENELNTPIKIISRGPTHMDKFQY